MPDDGTRAKSTRGFASMDAAKQREIASKGGQSVPPEKRSFSQNPQLAAEAGRKGGLSVSNADRSFSRNRRLAAEAGRKGGSQSSSGGQKRTTASTGEESKNAEAGIEAADKEETKQFAEAWGNSYRDKG